MSGPFIPYYGIRWPYVDYDYSVSSSVPCEGLSCKGVHHYIFSRILLVSGVFECSSNKLQML